MTTTVASLLARAASQIGTYERTGQNDVLYSDYYGITGYSWCYAFVQWCFETDNARLPFTTMYVPAGVGWSRQNLQSVERGSPPQPGDIAHFTWSMSEWPPTRPGTGDHVGLVESWNGADTLTTIEGNVGAPQGVWRMKRSINATIINFWRPVGVYAAPAKPVPDPPKDDDDMMHQYRDVSNGTVYVTWGMFKSPLEDDGVRQGLMTMGLLAPPDTYFEQNPGMLSEFVTVNQDVFANIAGSVNAGRNEQAMQAKDIMENSNRLAAGINTGGGTVPVLDVAASLKKASIAQLFDEIASRTKGNEAA